MDALNDNLNSAEAFAIIDNSILNLDDWEKIDEFFGLNLVADSPDINSDTRKLIAERAEARKNRDFARADEMRDELAAQGIAVRDTDNGSIWEYI